MSAELVKYDAMCRAIAEAHAIDEVKDIRDKAVALEADARQIGNTEAEDRCYQIRMRRRERPASYRSNWRAPRVGKHPPLAGLSRRKMYSPPLAYRVNAPPNGIFRQCPKTSSERRWPRISARRESGFRFDAGPVLKRAPLAAFGRGALPTP